MEKKGEILNQLAIISDLLEKANIESENTTVIFTLSETDLNKIYTKVTKKIKSQSSSEKTETTFSVKIGEIEFVFTLNKNNV